MRLIMNNNLNTNMKNKIPYDFWNYGINPILGYRWKQTPLNAKPRLNRLEYKKQDNE